MSHDIWTDRLSEFLDGDVSAEERGACEAHLASCAECSRTLASLRELLTQARSLPDRAPERDLWPGIEARLAGALTEHRGTARGPRMFKFGLPRHVHLSLPQALAAGIALVLLSGSMVWWLLRHETPAGPGALESGAGLASAVRPNGAAPGPESSGAASPQAGARTLAPRGSGASDVARYAAYEARYEGAIAELERTLQEHRTELDTSTVRVVEQNLVIIDRAIAQARRALESDPASPYLHQHLALQMKLKLDLLRRTAAYADGQG